jgi:hypothetical protein
MYKNSYSQPRTFSSAIPTLAKSAIRGRLVDFTSGKTLITEEMISKIAPRILGLKA